MARQDREALLPAQGAAGLANAGEVFYALGVQYATGRGVEQNLVEAHKWLNIAWARGYKAAAAYRSEIARELSESQIMIALRQAREWLSRN